jgi:hypothetical protein
MEVGTVIRANAVKVAKLFQAQCQIDGCDWAGELLGSYQEANIDRQDHLDWHRYQEMGVAP